jgi:hypothetical protein
MHVSATQDGSGCMTPGAVSITEADGKLGSCVNVDERELQRLCAMMDSRFRSAKKKTRGGMSFTPLQLVLGLVLSAAFRSSSRKNVRCQTYAQMLPRRCFSIALVASHGLKSPMPCVVWNSPTTERYDTASCAKAPNILHLPPMTL